MVWQCGIQRARVALLNKAMSVSALTAWLLPDFVVGRTIHVVSHIANRQYLCGRRVCPKSHSACQSIDSAVTFRLWLRPTSVSELTSGAAFGSVAASYTPHLCILEV
jgi:hypothetical protein